MAGDNDYILGLLWRVKNGHELDAADRDFVAALVRKQIKGPAHRPPNDNKRLIAIAMTALRYQCEDDCCLEAGVAEAVRVHRVSTRQVYRALEECRKLPIETSTSIVCGVVRRFVRRQNEEWQEVEVLYDSGSELPRRLLT